MRNRSVQFSNGVEVHSVRLSSNDGVADIKPGIYVECRAGTTIDDCESDRRVEFEWMPGHIGFSPPGLHGAKAEYPAGVGAFIAVSIPDSMITGACHCAGASAHVLRGKVDHVAAGLVHALRRAGQGADVLFVEHMSMALARRAASWFCQGQEKEPTACTSRMARAIDYINDNISKPMTTKELAGVACMSEFHFARQFKTATGRPPHEYVTWRRVQRAKMMLIGAGMSIAFVALACGFSSQSHFSKAFRGAVGVSPGQYQRSVRGT